MEAYAEFLLKPSPPLVEPQGAESGVVDCEQLELELREQELKLREMELDLRRAEIKAREKRAQEDL